MILDLAKSALRLVVRRRNLWFFGFFVAAAGFGVHFDASHFTGIGELPAWLPLALAGVGVLVLVVLALRVVSEGALIDAVRRDASGGDVRFGAEARAGLGTFGELLGLKLLVMVAAVAAIGLIAAPMAAVLLAHGPIVLGIVLTVLLALVAVPVLLTGFIAYNFAMRFLVIEGRGVMDAVRDALELMHGRIATSLGVLVAAAVGAAVLPLIALVPVLVAAAVGVAVYFLGGLWPAVTVGAVLAAPFVFAAIGMAGTWRSAMWTLAFLDLRSA